MSYSKSKVDRAGKTLADRLRLIVEGKAPVNQQDPALREAIQIIEWWRGEHAKPLSRVGAKLGNYAGEQGKPIVTQRLKKFPTIAGKLLREPSMKLSRMADIGGVRAVLPDQDAAYRVAGRLRKNWTIIRFRDYVAEPKPDGYRALHLINRNRGRLIEVQLRTPHQETWANGVEIFSRAAAPGLKFGNGPPELQEFFTSLGELFASVDQGRLVDPVLFDRVKDLRKQADTFIERAINEP
jgi:hypothetical protein